MDRIGEMVWTACFFLRIAICKTRRKPEEGAVIEVHVPHAARPLNSGLEAIGVTAVLNMLAPGHYRILCVKI